MRRDVLVKAVERLGEDIRSAGLIKMFEEATESVHLPGKQDDRNWFSLAAFQKYSVLTANYGDVEMRIAKILEIDDLFSSDFWTRLSRSPDADSVFGMRRKLFYIQSELPKLLALLQQDHVAALKSEAASRQREFRDKELITFVLPEEDNVFSTPARLIAALEAVTGMYSVFATLDGHSESDLILLALDSGSDKSFDLLGLAKVMEEVRKLVLAIWDRRVFYRHSQVSQCIAFIADSLPVLERIDELKQRNVIGPEQAELLKRKAIHSATQFLESGVIISEMDAQATQSARLLLRPEQKLLAGPVPTGATVEDATELSEHEETTKTGTPNSLSEDEIAQLHQLLYKAKSGAAQPPKDEPKTSKSLRRKNS